MRKVPIDEKWLKEQYLDKKRSAVDISKEIGCSNALILRRLRSLGVKIRTPQEETLIKTNNAASELYRNRDWLYDQYVVQQKHLREIARELNCDDSILSDWLKRFNISIYENKNIANYLGIFIAERVLSKYFDNITKMPPKNEGYDFVCAKGYRIDVKSSVLHQHKGRNETPYWMFVTNYNRIADYFLCIGFDDRECLNPIGLWLIPNNSDIRKLHSIIITSSDKGIDKWKEYEKPIDKVEICCEHLRTEES